MGKINVTGDRNNPLLFVISNPDVGLCRTGDLSHQREELTGTLYYSMYCPLYFNNPLTWMDQIWYTDAIKDAEFKFINGLSKLSYRLN